MSNIVGRKTENYKKLSIVNFHQNLRKKEQFRNGAFLFAFGICNLYLSVTGVSLVIKIDLFI